MVTKIKISKSKLLAYDDLGAGQFIVCEGRLFIVCDGGSLLVDLTEGETFDTVWVCDKVFEVVEDINIEVVL